MAMLCSLPWLLLQTSSGISTLRLAPSAAGQRAGAGVPGAICDLLKHSQARRMCRVGVQQAEQAVPNSPCLPLGDP